jgi:signal transduction histidine kinase/ActR/RegA family two-component response regulator
MLLAKTTLRSLAPLIAGFALLFLVAGSAIWLSARQDNVVSWVRHTLEVQNRLSDVRALATDAETGQRGYLLTGREGYLAPFQDAKKQLSGQIDALAEQTADNPQQSARVADLRSVLAAKFVEMQSTVDERAAGHAEAAVAIVDNDSGAKMMAHIRAIVREMGEEENNLLKKRSESAERVSFFVDAALASSAVLVIVLAFFTLREGSRRLADLQTSNQQLKGEIVEREAAEGKVRQLQKIQAIGQLTGGIAHDFNNMLAVVIGSLDMAKRRISASEHPTATKYLDYAAEGAQRAATLTSRLLAFSRQQPLEPKAVDTNHLVAGMSELLRRSLGAQIAIETVLSGGLWRSYADPAQLESAILNIAVNARDAMPDGGKLTIETSNADLDERYARANSEVKAGQYVLISATDTGGGMAPDVIERAFDPFFTTKAVGRGTGLGLSQVFGFVKQSGGHVKLYSERGVGTTVKIYLPRHRGADSAEIGASTAAAMPLGDDKEIVLVVEDDSAVRAVSVSVLRELGYTVVEASSPKQALQCLDAREDIGLLFTDIVMPEMNGRQLVEKALEKRPDLRVLYTTGYTRNAVVHNGAVDAGTPFISKPFTVDQLAAKIREALDAAD